jgi:hypothetical protein
VRAGERHRGKQREQDHAKRLHTIKPRGQSPCYQTRQHAGFLEAVANQLPLGLVAAVDEPRDLQQQQLDVEQRAPRLRILAGARVDEQPRRRRELARRAHDVRVDLADASKETSSISASRKCSPTRSYGTGKVDVCVVSGSGCGATPAPGPDERPIRTPITSAAAKPMPAPAKRVIVRMRRRRSAFRRHAAPTACQISSRYGSAGAASSARRRLAAS